MKNPKNGLTVNIAVICLVALLWSCGGGGSQNAAGVSSVQVTATSANTAPANITIAATVTGKVTKVEFYNGAAKLGEVTAAPYQYALKDATAGTYYFTIKAYDDKGAVTTKTASITIKDGFLALADSGTFTIGDDTMVSSGVYRAAPAHPVTVSSFYISKYELTFDEFDAFTSATGRPLVTDTFGTGRGNHSLYNISWYDAIEYCNWRSVQEGLAPVYTIDKTNKDPNNTALDTADNKKWTVTADWSANGYRLPTEAEWEFAAKGGSKSKGFTYSGSNDVKEVAWYGGKAYAMGHYTSANVTKRGDLRLTGSLKANELGIYDMSGNVSEWVWDKYDTLRPGYAGSQAGVTETNPTGITGAYDKFLFRGGSSGGPPACMLPAKRFIKDATFNMCPAGIRLARSVSK